MCIPYNKAARRTLPIYVGIVGRPSRAMSERNVQRHGGECNTV